MQVCELYSVDQRSPRRKEINRHLTIMARVLFFAILAMCLVCMIQASPVTPDGVTERDFVKEVGTAFNSAVETIQKTGEAIRNDPNVQKFVGDAAKVIQDGAKAIQENVAQYIPKTA